jgi:hypothetical protein
LTLKIGLNFLEDLKEPQTHVLNVFIDGSKEHAWIEENRPNFQVFGLLSMTQMLPLPMLELESEKCKGSGQDG